MEKEMLERYLSRKIWKRRTVLLILTVILFALGFAGAHFLESVNKNANSVLPDLLIAMVCVGMCGGALAVGLLIGDFLACRYKTVYKGEQYLTVYRGLLFIVVYVDGVEKGRSIPMRECMIVEVWLANRVRATVHFTTSILNIAHISFSDDTATMEV